MANRIFENVDEDHIGVKPDGIIDEAGPFVQVQPARHDRSRLMGRNGEILKDTVSNRGSLPENDRVLAVTVGKDKKSGVVGMNRRTPSTQPKQQKYGRGNLTLRFFDGCASLIPGIIENIRYTRPGILPSASSKSTIEHQLETTLLSIAGRYLHRIDTGEEYTFEELEELGTPYKDITKDRIIPRDMPFANVGGPLFGGASLGYNSIFFYVFKINNTYNNTTGDRWELQRGQYWMLRVTKTSVKDTKKIKAVEEGDDGPEVVEKSIEYDMVTDDSIDHNTPFPRNTFEVSWLGDGLPIELDDRDNIEDSQGKTVYNPDHMYRTRSGRMPVWRNIKAPEVILEKTMAYKTQADENIDKSEQPNTNAHKEFWSGKTEQLNKHVEETSKWNHMLDHYLLHFGNPPKAATCIWSELTNGTYSMRVDAARSGFCGFDLTYPNRYAVGKFEGGEFIKPSAPGSDNDKSPELDMKVLRDTNRNDEFHVYLRPRTMRFAATTIYYVGYINFIFGIPVFSATLWPQSMDTLYFAPWTNAGGGGESFMVNGSVAAVNYANSLTPIPLNTTAFIGATGGLPITWFVVSNIWNIYVGKHNLKDKDNEDGVPVAVIRKFHKNGGSDLYCVYYFDDDEPNPINTEELLFTWAV